MCCSNIIKILSGAMTLLFFFVRKFGKRSTTFISWHASMQMCAKLCLTVMNRDTRNWRQTLHQINEYKFIANFYGSKGSTIYLGMVCFQCQMVA
jgi:hypothetical protein